jgi:uncharacterized protein (DUF697 family)
MDKRKQAEGIVMNYTLMSGGLSLIPLPWMDIAGVTALQLEMLEKLASHYQVDYSKTRAKAFIASLTSNVAAKFGASLVKAIPVIGPIVGGVSGIVFLGGATFMIGSAAVEAFESGEDLIDSTLKPVKKVYEQALGQGMKKAQDLRGKPSPGKGKKKNDHQQELLNELEEVDEKENEKDAE